MSSPDISRPNLAAVRDTVAGVKGWMTPGQASALYDAASRCPSPGRIVEIGSFHGRSTIVLASAAAPGIDVVAIDPHAGNDRGPQEIDGFVDEAADDHAQFTANLAAAGVSERVTHLRAFSDDAHGQVPDDGDGGIDVLYIDGAHRYQPALADIRSWGDRVRPGGTMLIHDSFSSIGVTLAIVRQLMFGSRFSYIDRSRSMTIYRAAPTGKLDAGARVRSSGLQLAQLPWFAKNVALKVLLSAGLGKLMAKFGKTAPEWPY